jgi:hypothetical protein
MEIKPKPQRSKLRSETSLTLRILSEIKPFLLMKSETVNVQNLNFAQFVIMVFSSDLCVIVDGKVNSYLGPLQFDYLGIVILLIINQYFVSASAAPESGILRTAFFGTSVMITHWAISLPYAQPPIIFIVIMAAQPINNSREWIILCHNIT